MLDVKIYIEGQRVDLFKDENISIKSTVKDISDISKVFTDFSKSFTVPASKNNNLLFEHWYNADITGGFDARTSKDALIEINSIEFTKGKMSLEKVSISNGNIENYAIRFTGDTIKIKKILGEDKLSDLDFSNLNHNFDSATVEQGATSSLFGGKVIYPLISVARRFFYDTNNTTVNNDTQVNTHYDSGQVNNSIYRKDLKPAIKVSDVFFKVLSDYNLDIRGDIFSRDYFTDMFMWLNKEAETLKANPSAIDSLIDFSSGDTTYTDLSTDETILTETVGVENSNFSLQLTANPTASYVDVEYNIVARLDGAEVYRSNAIKGSTTHLINVAILGLPYTWHIETSDLIDIDFYQTWFRTNILSYFPFATDYASGRTFTNTLVLTGIVDISNQIPDIKIIDFIMGIVKMFNLVIIPNNDGGLEFITMKEWYNLGGVWDISEYIDRDKIKVGKGKLINNFKFNYEKPQTLLNKQFLQNTGVAYGDLDAKLYDSNGDLLDGTSLTVKLPFENMIYERVNDLVDGANTTFQYGFAVDDKLEPTATKLIMFYNENVDTSTNQIGWLNDAGVHSAINNINVPNNTRSLTDNTQQSINWGNEFSAYNYGEMEQSLYKSFYEDYIADMFSIRRRQYTYEGYLPLNVLTQLKLNDRLVIDNYRYIINGIDKQITTGFVKLDLLNDIYTEGENNLEEINLSTESLNISSDANTFQITVASSGVTSVEILDGGSGIFVSNAGTETVTDLGTFTFSILENSTAYSRVQLIRFTNGDKWIDYIVTQDGAIDLFDIKVDTTLLTVDTTTLTI